MNSTLVTMEFKTVDALAQKVDAQTLLWKSLPKHDAYKHALATQLELNSLFLSEIQRLREEFVHFKIHALSKLTCDGPSVEPTGTADTKCINNPFRLYVQKA